MNLFGGNKIKHLEPVDKMGYDNAQTAILTRVAMSMEEYPKAQNPLMLRFHRLMDAFAKSDDERDFYLDKVEGFLFFVDLDKGQSELEDLESELKNHAERYVLIPKMTFYETKKFMEGFINEKVYDIDTKEKLIDIIQSKDARENFIEFIYDHLSELEKWQQYYHERSRIRIIEWLRAQQIQFIFEEDLDFGKSILEKLKRHLFDAKVVKDITAARELLFVKAKTYYSSEALNPRPKRGRPPKQTAKTEAEPQIAVDLYTQVPNAIRPFLYMTQHAPHSVTFSSKFETAAEIRAKLRGAKEKVDSKLEALSQRLESLSRLSAKLLDEPITFDLEGDRQVTKKQGAPESGERKLTGLFKGLLPKARGAAPIDNEEEQKKPTVKKVFHISKKKPRE